MKFNHIIKILTLVLFSTFAQAYSNTIEPQALLKLIQKQQAPLILDVRSAEEFAQGHIQGALNIAYDQLLENRQLNSYKERDIIVHCHSGIRAKIAANVLQEKGLKRLVELHGHISLWQKLGYPLVP